MKFYGRTQPLKTLPIDACLRRLAELGFDGAEICLENPDIAPDTLDEARARELARWATDAGLGGWSISYHRDYVYDDAELERTCNAIALTPAFGADVFVFGGGVAKADDPDPWDRIVRRTSELVAQAERSQVTIALEFEPGFIIASTQSLLDLMAEVNSPRLAANLDIGHAFLCDPQPLESIALLAGRFAPGHGGNM